MNINFFENLNNAINQENQSNNILRPITDDVELELELAQKLDAFQEFSVDRIEENIVVLENRENGETVNIEKSKLPAEIKEGDILKYINGRYILDKKKTITETEEIKEIMDNLWN